MSEKKRKSKGSKTTSSKSTTKKFPWRTVKTKWMDTMFDKRLLVNPSLMTNTELSSALYEYTLWRKGVEKYAWNEDPVKENAETECPFSAPVLGNILLEIYMRLKLIGSLSEGRFKRGSSSCTGKK